jgi:hypothetical protein
MTLPCFCCGKALESVDPLGDDDNEPSEATTFRTGGHYGSGAFDPMDGSMLELNVCDDCLTGGAERVVLLRTVQTVQTTSSAWIPD